ncbi:hypothetical protein [Olivibacter sp. XZL3]|uniref:hypothetical protein n=1 Tax=Olivibacter sp. XZL3 TaxID=1735116 RepID=UPI001F10DA52|nr:hypothetical protein [Olivibacter sp. XZL3]
MKTKKREVHIVQPYLLNPTNPVTVNLIGAGGTGKLYVNGIGKNELCPDRIGTCRAACAGDRP